MVHKNRKPELHKNLMGFLRHRRKSIVKIKKPGNANICSITGQKQYAHPAVISLTGCTPAEPVYVSYSHLKIH
jgi:hypothetical protein